MAMDLKSKRELLQLEKDIKDIKLKGNKADDKELKSLDQKLAKVRAIKKEQAIAQKAQDDAAFKLAGLQSNVNTLQEKFGKLVGKSGKEVFQFSKSFVASARYLDMAGIDAGILAVGIADATVQANRLAQSAEDIDDIPNNLLKGMNEVIGSIIETKNRFGTDLSASQIEHGFGGKKAQAEVEAYKTKTLDPLISKLTEVGTSAQEMGVMVSESFGDAIDMSGQLMESASKVGSEGFTSMVAEAEKAKDVQMGLFEEMKKRKEIQQDQLKDLAGQAKQVKDQPALYKKVMEQITKTKKSITSTTSDMARLYDSVEDNIESAKRLEHQHGMVSEATAFVTAPFDKMKTAIEALPMGGLISKMVNLDEIGNQFKKTSNDAFQGFTQGLLDAQETDEDGNMTMNMDKVSDAAEKARDILSGGMGKSIEGLSQGLKLATKGAWQFVTAALANPYVAVAAAIALIGVLLYKAVSYAEAMRQEFGVTRGEAFDIQSSVDATATSFKMLGVSAEDVGTMAQGIADSMGGVNNITKENLDSMANLTALYGMSADSIAPAMTAMKALGAESNEAASAQLAQIGHMAQMEGVAPAKVFEDITANMGTFSRFGKEGGKNLAKASIMARKLGTSLESMAATSDALLDFESNINDQMEASMLLGRSINMDKARELALAGDMAGQEREILKQIGTQAEFEAMNVVQRDALAKATGKSTEDLASMLANQANLNAMTAEERAEKERMQRADEKTNEGMKSMGSMLGDLFKQAMEPLKQLMIALGPTLGAILKVLAVTLKVAWAPLKVVFAILNPIIKLLGWMLDLIITIGGAIMKVLVFPFQLLWEGIKAAFGLLMNVVKAPFNFIIAGVNAMINGLNALSITVPDWVPLIGGKQFGFNIPTVPSLETKAGGPGHNVTETGVAEVHKGESVGTFDMKKVEGKLDELIQLMGQQGPIALGVNQTKVNTARVADSIV